MSTTETLAFHPYANIFPLLDGEDFAGLVADVRQYGLLEPITVDEQNRILDGRNRYRACVEAGVEPLFEPFLGDDALQFVISRNLHRRHLDTSQRSAIAATLETMKHGGDRRSGDQDANLHLERADAAKMMNVSSRSVADAATVRDKGTPELWDGVQKGKIAVSTAAKLVDAPVEVQQQALAEPKKAQTLAKQHRREEREEELNEATYSASQALGTQLYSVIYADPAWRFEPYSRDTGMDRAADNHYPTMTIDKLKEIKVPAADDCVLFLWRTAPMLDAARAVMEAWGFEYVTEFVWVKDRIGTGYWNRNQHEILMVGKKGSPPAPAPGTQPSSVINAAVAEHSVKPAAFAAMIEEMFPSQHPMLEMFARSDGRRWGWHSWGNEAQPFVPRSISAPQSDIPVPQIVPMPVPI